MSKSPFIFCNQCFESAGETKHKFLISNCFHVFCAGCVTNKNICSICNKKCKLLPIEKNIPKEVRIYFEPNAHEQLMHTIAKIHEFQQAQAKLYVSKQYHHRKKYYERKQKVLELRNYKKKVMENSKRERSIMDRLKDAYKSNVITPDLFQMRSQAGSPYGLKTPDEITSSSNLTKSRVSAASSVFRERNHTTKEIPYMTMSAFSQNPQSSNRVTISSKENVVREARKNMVAHTLRDMNQATQRKTQIRESQMTNRYFKL